MSLSPIHLVHTEVVLQDGAPAIEASTTSLEERTSTAARRILICQNDEQIAKNEGSPKASPHRCEGTKCFRMLEKREMESRSDVERWEEECFFAIPSLEILQQHEEMKREELLETEHDAYCKLKRQEQKRDSEGVRSLLQAFNS